MSAEYWSALHGMNLALSLTYEALAPEPHPDPLVRRNADGTFYLYHGRWERVGRDTTPKELRQAHLAHEVEMERRRKYGC